MCKFISSQKEESRAQSTDSSWAYSKPGAFSETCQVSKLPSDNLL